MLLKERQEFLTTQDHELKLLPEMSDSALNRLLLLFPNAAPAHIPVRVKLPVRAQGASEKSAIVFGVKDTVIFTVDYPLNCGEKIHVRLAAGSGEASAIVVAIMPNGRGTVAAVRFPEGAPKWARKP